MKLVEILARDLKEWPEGAEYIVQDYDGEFWPSDRLEDFPPELIGNNCWRCSFLNVGDFYLETAEDFQTAIVTKEQWKEERAKLEKEHTCFSTFPNPGERCKVMVDLDGNTVWVPCYIVGMDDQGFCVYSVPDFLADQTGLPYDGAPSPSYFAPLSEAEEEVTKHGNAIYEVLKDRDKTLRVVTALYGDSWINQCLSVDNV